MMKTKKTADETKKGAQHKDELARLEDQLKRALADYHNLEKRVDEERKLLAQLSAAIVIEKFLPILDNLENARKHLKDEGLEMVVKQFKDVLNSEGVEEIEAQGSQFNPHLHEATEVEQGENDNLVVRVVRKGYKINDKIIRVAQVVVTRKKVDPEVEEKAEKAKEFGDYA